MVFIVSLDQTSVDRDPLVWSAGFHCNTVRIAFELSDLLSFVRSSRPHLSCSPGINRISLRLQSRPSAPASQITSQHPSTPRVPHSSTSNSIAISTISPSAPLPTSHPTHSNPSDHQIFDEHGSPFPEYYGPLMETFFTTLCLHFPSVSRRRMEERLETGTMSAFFLNC